MIHFEGSILSFKAKGKISVVSSGAENLVKTQKEARKHSQDSVTHCPCEMENRVSQDDATDQII